MYVKGKGQWQGLYVEMLHENLNIPVHYLVINRVWIDIYSNTSHSGRGFSNKILALSLFCFMLVTLHGYFKWGPRVRFSMVSLVFLVDFILPTSLKSWVGSASNRIEYQEYFLGSKGGRCDNITSCCVDRLEIWEPQLLETLRTFQGAYSYCCTETGSPRVRLPMRSLEYFWHLIVRPHYGLGVDSAPNGNEYQFARIMDLWIDIGTAAQGERKVPVQTGCCTLL